MIQDTSGHTLDINRREHCDTFCLYIFPVWPVWSRALGLFLNRISVESRFCTAITIITGILSRLGIFTSQFLLCRRTTDTPGMGSNHLPGVLYFCKHKFTFVTFVTFVTSPHWWWRGRQIIYLWIMVDEAFQSNIWKSLPKLSCQKRTFWHLTA